MVPYVARNSFWRLLLLWALSLAFFFAGAWLAGILGGDPPRLDKRVVGWGCMAFFGLCALLIPTRMFDRDDQLRITSHGIMYKGWSSDTILWSEITDVQVWELHRQRSIILTLKNPNRFPSTSVNGIFGNQNRAMIGGDLAIELTGTDGRFDDAMAAINYFRRSVTQRG